MMVLVLLAARLLWMAAMEMTDWMSLMGGVMIGFIDRERLLSIVCYGYKVGTLELLASLYGRFQMNAFILRRN